GLQRRPRQAGAMALQARRAGRRRDFRRNDSLHRNAAVRQERHVQRHVLLHDVHRQAAIPEAAAGHDRAGATQEGRSAVTAGQPDDQGQRAAGADPAIAGLDVYIVGGAVRDALLGGAAQDSDRDWVVVGATPEQMADRGFIPVGGDFPVFLHPRSKEEYALARTERKSGRGYKGFTFYTGTDVTLEDDLRRRDLTINAIAQAPDGRLVDPLGGRADIRDRIFRHVGQAFVEDPVRLLRLARFAARFPDFSIAPETMDLARRLVDEGEVDALVPERVWREM